MSRRAITSVLGATVLLAASVAGASSAHALASGATAPEPRLRQRRRLRHRPAGRRGHRHRRSRHLRCPARPRAVGGATDQADDYSIVSQHLRSTPSPSGEPCTVTVAFNPFAAGLRQATLDIETTTPAATVPVGLSGTAVPNATGTYYGAHHAHRGSSTPGPTDGLPLAAGSTTSVQITTRAGIPATGVSAVVFNLTAVATTASGYFTTYPSGKPRPTTSSINFPTRLDGRQHGHPAGRGRRQDQPVQLRRHGARAGRRAGLVREGRHGARRAQGHGLAVPLHRRR